MNAWNGGMKEFLNTDQTNKQQNRQTDFLNDKGHKRSPGPWLARKNREKHLCIPSGGKWGNHGTRTYICGRVLKLC